jgi:transcription termination factor NusA
MSTSIEKVPGIGPATAAVLQNHGIHNAEDLAAQRAGDLAAIKGFNSLRAGQVIDAAKQLIAATVSDNPEPVVEPDKKDKGKKDKKKKKNKDLKKKSLKSEKKKSSKTKKKSSPKKGKDKKKPKGSKKKSLKT